MNETLDNFFLNVRARAQETFNHSLAIAFANCPGRKANHWCEHPKYGLVLFWRAEQNEQFNGRPIVQFPHELDCEAASSFVWNWLIHVDRERFELEWWDNRHSDGGNVQYEKAWRIYVGDWGCIDDSRCAIVAVLPVWAWLYK